MTWFLSRLARRVAEQPQAVALEDGSTQLTYSRLWDEVERVGRCLAGQGMGPERLVGLRMAKSIDYIVAALGAWRCGAAFLPLDPGLPPARLKQIQEMAACDLVLSQLPQSPPRRVPSQLRAGALAYVIFTSGSTGVPKGVEVTHRGLPYLYKAQIPAFRLGPGARMLWLLSIQFDASLSDLGCALLSGATLCLPRLPPSELPRDLAQQGITHLDIPPALLHLYLPQDVPEHVGTLVAGGEASAPEVLRRWARTRHLVQVYGPTEATICTSMIRVDPDSWAEPRLGPPIAGMRHFVLDDQGEPVQEGELCLSGPGLARGYRGQSALTDSRFFSWRGRRLYRTGDRVRRCPGGDCLFLGRKDRQFKVQGRLVEPQEVETVMLSCPGVTRAAVLSDTRGRLRGFYAGSAPAEELTSFLRQRLPEWMVPPRWHRPNPWPETSSGKPDLAALAQLPVPEDRVLADHGLTSLETMEWMARLQRRGIYLTAEEVMRSTPGELDRLCLARGASEYEDADRLRRVAAEVLAFHPGRADGGERGRAALVTGATGLLGSRLLEALLAEDAFERVYCLARNPSRLPSHPCLKAVRGDLLHPRWGLSEWELLAQEVGVIFHLAAEVNTVLPFQRLRAANLDSLAPLVEFLGQGPKKRLHYASTLSVFVSTDRNQGLLREDDDLSATRRVYGGYAQSKWAAEWLLRQLPPDLAVVSIYRYGLLVGGASDFLTTFCRGLCQLGSYPRGATALRVDITPVTFAAQATVAAALRGPAGTYHVANQQSASLQDLVDGLRRAGHRLEEVDPCRFFALPASTPAQAAAQLALCRHSAGGFEAQRSLDFFQATGVTFQVDNLRRLGWICPAPTELGGGLRLPRNDASG